MITIELVGPCRYDGDIRRLPGPPPPLPYYVIREGMPWVRELVFRREEGVALVVDGHPPLRYRLYRITDATGHRQEVS